MIAIVVHYEVGRYFFSLSRTERIAAYALGQSVLIEKGVSWLSSLSTYALTMSVSVSSNKGLEPDASMNDMMRDFFSFFVRLVFRSVVLKKVDKNSVM